jgi:hypothetical protein
MWEPQPLATLRASTACYRDSFTFTFLHSPALKIHVTNFTKQQAREHTLNSRKVKLDSVVAITDGFVWNLAWTPCL